MNLFGRKSSPAAAKSAPGPVENDTPPAAVAPPPAEPAPAVPAPAVPARAVPAPAEPAPVAAETPATEPAATPAPATPAESALAAQTAAAATAANTAARLAFLDKGTAAMTSTPPKPPASFLPGGSLPGAAARSDQPRRTLDLPGAGGLGVSGLAGARRVDEPAATVPAAPPAPAAPAQRRLIVGRDISLAGEIASCDVLVVEGTVEAKLRDGHSVEITETGLFKGSVEIDDADIGGRFEGDLVVRNRLRVRSGGRIIGSIVYGELEVESGGRLEGSIKLYDPQPKVEVAAVPAPAAAPVVVEAAPEPVAEPAPEQTSGDVQPAQVYVPPTQTFNG